MCIFNDVSQGQNNIKWQVVHVRQSPKWKLQNPFCRPDKIICNTNRRRSCQPRWHDEFDIKSTKFGNYKGTDDCFSRFQTAKSLGLKKAKILNLNRFYAIKKN